jgi:uncharacterized protein
MRGGFFVGCLLFLAPLPALGASMTVEVGSPAPYVLPNTQVRALHSEETGADYQLFIATPPDYRTSGKTYPVVFMLDADYSFALTRNIVQHFVERHKLPEMILVAIAYPGAAEDMDVYKSNRTRDYTPSLATANPGVTEEAQASGGAVRFRNFIANEAIPFMATSFPISADRTFIGHSYGGLFGTYVLLTEPELFKRYVIVSPSLWYDDRMIFRVEQQTASRRRERPIERHAFFAIGAAETRAEAGAPMVDELKQFYRKLKTRRENGLTIDMRVYPEDTHSSVFPGAVSRGLLAVFPAPQS